MAAQPSSASTGFDLPPAPQTREEFVQIFGEELVTQSDRLVFDAIVQTTRSVAHFTSRDVIRSAKRMAEFELARKVLENEHFQPLLEFLFAQNPMMELGRTRRLTTPDMWNKEAAMIKMAGELSDDHIIPEEVVDQALGSRTWVPRKDLPDVLRAAYEAEFPGKEGDMLEVRRVVQVARAQGYEVFGVGSFDEANGADWNREGATALSPEVVGAPEEFLQALEASNDDGEDWFLKPTLFIGDNWSTPAAKKLKALAHSNTHAVHTVSRTGISGEQTRAVIAVALGDRRVPVIEGTAGAGKSFTMKSVYEIFQSMGYDVMGTALGWSAAKVLSASTGLPEKSCRAMEGFLNSIRKARDLQNEFFNRKTLIIVDEAGMVGTYHMHDLLAMTRHSKFPIKVVLTGDSLQVAPVAAGNALEAIVDTYGTVRINTIRRQKQVSHRESVVQFSAREAGRALYSFINQESVRWCEDRSQLFNNVVRDFVSYRQAYPDKKALVLAYTNEDVVELNARIRQVYKKAGLIEPNEVRLDVTDGRRTWKAGFSIGDEVVLRANDQNLPIYYVPPVGTPVDDETKWGFKTTGVFNRNAGRIVCIRHAASPIGSYDFVLDLEGEETARVVVNSHNFKHQEKKGMPMVHNFATTIYASQGQTVNKVMMLDSPQLNFRLAYVGMSRHTESVDIYLNVTELHERLDKMMGRSPSKPIHNKTPDQYTVELGRYSNGQMLQAVAAGWAQEADNLTATIFEKRKRLTKQQQYDQLQVFSKVQPTPGQSDVMDFIPSLNVAYPMIDLAKILSLPDPVGETEFVRPSDTEKNRASTPLHESPIRYRTDAEQAPLPALKKEGEGLLSRASTWLHKQLADKPEKLDVPASDKKHAKGSRFAHKKPVSAFKKEEVVEEVPDKLGMKDLVLEVIKLSLTPAPKAKIKMPFLPIPEPLGRVSEEGVLLFDNVPQTVAPEGTVIPGASDDYLKDPERGGRWWAVGRFGEPRVLSRNGKGQVVARYTLDGRCVVGDGLPPISYSPADVAETPVHIVPGPREWFLLQEIYDQKFKDDPSKRPHVVWAAQDVDWKLVAQSFARKQVFIVRSRHDQDQIPWALGLQKELGERWGLTTHVVPKVPELSSAPVQPPPLPEEPAAPRRRPRGP